MDTRLSLEGRHRLILDRLRQGSVSVPALAAEWGVAEITIRRDLDLLERRGKLLRVHGGAIPHERVAYEFSFKEKESLNREKKESVARAAAQLVEPGAAVFLDTGTTALSAARALRAVRPGVIVTINLCIASEYVGQRDTRVIMPGGEVGHLSPDLLGELTLQNLAAMTVDVAFLGCDSVDPADGFYTTDVRSAAVSRVVLERSRQAYLMADSSKFGRRSIFRIAPVSALQGVISDSALSDHHRTALTEAGARLILASSSDPSHSSHSTHSGEPHG